MVESIFKVAFLSASFPPSQYPILKLPRIIPINEVQVKIVVPKYGAIRRLPTSSRIMVLAPIIKTVEVMIIF